MSDASPQPERADPVIPGQAPRGMVDAEEFLAFTQRLRDLHTKVDAADVSERKRGQWQRQLLAVTEAARTDLARAKDRLERLERELDSD